MNLSQYVFEPLRVDQEFVLYRAEHSSERGLPSVLVLAPASEHPPLSTLKKIEHEYSLRHELDSAWAVRPLALSDQRGQTMLALEDPGGDTLEKSLSGPMETVQFLRVAIGLATALGGLHGRRLIHKDVKPANVLIDPATGQIRLMGFGIASRLPRERQAPQPPETIAGTLAYMAPEQTGRMNRSIDARSDLYALGITLYEMLTGSVPFSAADPMEWVHCHIARQPTPPSERVKHVPGSVSAIIMKLLAKTAEERYQTAAGLERDLRRCLAQFEAEKSIDDFTLGEQDTPDRLLIPEKLYGRAHEIEILLAAFDRIVKGGAPELVLVSGYAGIGKSSVVNELHKVVVPPRGLFAAGKFDQYKRDTPYSTLAQAFQDLVRPLLGQSEGELARWCDALNDALGPNGQLMVDLVPELNLIIGDQAQVPELAPRDARRRLQTVFRRFLAVFARPEHPLALFLDDLQWLDAATLDLLEDLLTQQDIRHLLLVGAYRDNDVTSTHPLTRRLEALRNGGALVQEIVLTPLTGEDVSRLIADSLHCDPERAMSLAQLVLEKTDGNPFFVVQFLSEMVEEELLTFDHGAGRWSWDVTHVHAKGYTDNVVDLMVGKLSRLPIDTQEALKQFACLGSSAESALLAMVREGSKEALDRDLEEALRAGLVLRSGDSYRFLHDRVQEAAYSLIPEAARPEVHLRIGRLLAAHTPPDKREETIFEIVNQLNRGAALMTSRDEKEQLAELNLMAGKRAKASTAYASALTYLVAGTSLLSDGGWEDRPDLMFALELPRGECEFLTGELATAEMRLTMLSSRASSPVDQAAVVCLQIQLYTILDQNDRAVDVSLAYLRRLGTDWSPHPTEDEARREYERVWSLLGQREIEEVIALPLMSEPQIAAIVGVLSQVTTAALLTDAHLTALVTCRLVNLSLEHGHTDASSFGYVRLGMLAGAHFGDYRAGFRFGQLGYDLTQRQGFGRFRGRVCMSFAVQIIPWTRHLRMATELLHQAFDAANAVGDSTCAGYSYHNLVANLLATGRPLADVEREAELGLAFGRRAGAGLVADITSAQLASIRNLRGLTTTFGRFDQAQFDEREFERHLAGAGVPFAACSYWIRKIQARFMAGDYAAAVEAWLNAQRLWTLPSVFESAEAHFYGALSRAASCDAASSEEYGQHLQALTVHHQQLERWTENCRENFENRALLVGAEIARLEGRELDAERLYGAAIQSAREHEFVQNEALANELAARFYAGRGLQTVAQAYLRNARYGYLRWGADGKVRQLDQLYPQLKTEEVPVRTGTIAAPLEQLDLATVIKVSQAVSSEMVLERLLDTLMRTAIEHAGAERGLLMLSGGDEQRIVAEATTSTDAIIVRPRDEPVTASMLPETILRYVRHTQESVILDDAATLNSFSTDGYLRERHSRSVLCLPLTNQAKLIGALYLENSLAPGVFTPARTAVLKLLASQAAISLENTRLYRDLAIDIHERKRAEELLAGEKQLLEMVASGRPLEDVLDTMCGFVDTVVGHCACSILLVDSNGTFRHGAGPTLPPGYDGTVNGASVVCEAGPCGTAASLKEQVIVPDLVSDQRWVGLAWRTLVLAHGLRSVCSTPIVSSTDKVLGTFAIYQREPGPPNALLTDLIARFTNVASIAIERAISYHDLQERERESRMIVDSIPGMVALLTPSGDVEVVNPQLIEYFGQTLEQLGQWRMTDTIHPEDLPHVIEAFTRAIASGSPYEIVQRFRRSDGVYRWFLNCGLPVRDPSGQIARWCVLLTDIDERKRAEDALRASEGSLQLIIDTIPALAWSARPDGSAEFFNQHWLDFVGLSAEQASDWDWTTAVHPEDVNRLAATWQGLMASEAAGEAEARLRRQDGSYRWFLLRANPLRDETGTIIKWYGINTDIEDRKRAEAELGALKDQLYQENLVLRDEVDRTSMFEEIVGTSKPLNAVLSRLSKVAPTDSTVLITGETGTGKELVARAIHRRSARGPRPFVSVNCAAVPRELIASELFGHEKGAFTGATQRRLGRFELAHGGTIFLDEVGELPMETQVALLRVLQEREFERVGGSTSIRVDVRVIAATNRDLQVAIEAGTFRSDLFYRLNVFPVAVPALRERADDISLLVEYFIDRYARKAGKTIRRVNKRTLDHLRSYPWPGNVRELQNVIERSVIVCDTNEFTVDESWLAARPAIENPLALSGTLAAHEKTIIEDALRACGGRVFGPSGAAERLGMPRSTLESKIRALKINKGRFRVRPTKS